MNGKTFQSTGSSEDNAPAISAIEFQALIEMVGADMPEVVIDLLDTYLQESAGLVEAVRMGIESGDLASALRPAHSLKSSSASIGAMRLSKYCADMEAHLRGSLPGLDVLGQAQLIVDEFRRVALELEIEKAKLSS